MKKILFILLSFICLSANAITPEITYDKINSDGSRFISCNYIFVGKWTDRIKTDLSLSAIQQNDSTYYFLSIKLNSLSNLNIKKESSLLIKLGNDDVIQLKTNIEYFDLAGKYDSYSKMVIYTILPSYEIDSNLIDKIQQYGIRKLRIETMTENIDRDIKGSKSKQVSSFLAEQYLLIKNQIDHKENDILNDF